VLAHLYPEADIPVVQLSINALKPLDYHVALGARLSGLRDQGVMIVASGNVVHNLRLIEWSRPDAGFDWAQRFDEAVVSQMQTAPADIQRVTEHPDYEKAVPTPDHFIPLLYLAGLAAEEGSAPAIVRGYSMGSLSMTCYGVGVDPALCKTAEGAAQLPLGVPADQTNT
jgi:4,5-DOPA dioxygenase extradiol